MSMARWPSSNAVPAGCYSSLVQISQLTRRRRIVSAASRGKMGNFWPEDASSGETQGLV
ncbi:unnamed protein product [Prunus armeniaca]